ncbi:AAA family ATPase [Vibrio parahaemolyticus]|uniref:AAA family ATPase n=4 Tax=Vibrio parahaemolyticus TaxID=670 RepID=UPI0009F14BE2|nr:AAA family ATPase [Vibrio parahaemolyticus]EJG0618784.1 AAA family ATPase [Vibrio parahaemolyticus]EJG0638285.1 AAA family ATPase [Vibrio parahaemolyticus]EJG0684200.1 AAA family ATPase [Vibrio parahaemolyticus]EJG0697528.1 AAA family ATPase [Vibrio parahaemolyticus]EJG0727935.1 AAA family ATPase [Vibrio parahaemolyticus]
MASIENQILSANQAICSNIASLSDHRTLLSQNILSQLRNLIEGIVVFTQAGTLQSDFHYHKVSPALEHVKRNGKLNFLAKFHKLIQKSASHYTFDGDASERLMLKYYEYLLRSKNLLGEHYNVSILENLESFPIDLDPSLREYHERIAERIHQHPSTYNHLLLAPERYYIHKTRPFFCDGRIFYEVTFYRAVNRATKADRVIAFTNIDISDNYAAMLTLQQDSISVIGYTMPIIIIRQWEVSIRPCEFDNLAKLLNAPLGVRTNSPEYRFLMNMLTSEAVNLLDLIDMSDQSYNSLKAIGTQDVTTLKVFPILDVARNIARSRSSGYNVIRYLMLRMYNKTLKSQFYRDLCNPLSGLRLKYGCIPFDQMPFCTSLPGHNPRYWDLVESLDMTNREHELLVRQVKNNVEHHGVLYTPIADLLHHGDTNSLVSTFNSKLYYKHFHRQLIVDKGHVFVRGYETDTAEIVKKLQEKSSSGVQGYTQAVERWLRETTRNIDDPLKINALVELFSRSYVALIYGAAGTGKSTMVDHIANYFNDKEKLFLAHTNPAIDNLKRKVSAQNSTFKTIRSHTYSQDDTVYDVLIIDECSTVSNADLLTILENTSFELLILVGDSYQIESIQFGNWFWAISSFIPNDSIFELKTPYRTSSESLLNFWNKVRNIEDDIAECMAQNGYSTLLSSELFEMNSSDEIVLCLNYDGLYGINNVNRFMQSSNQSPAFSWREATFKVGDPILFSDTERFRPVIYNNLKGRIVAIDTAPGWIQFDVWLDRPVSEFDVYHLEDLEWVSDSVVRFTVFDLPGSSDEDDDSHNTTVPFQVAYAVSIHKAQGLEYESVKIVITDANEDDVSHSIFYTAVTRARKYLKIFWTPETQQSVLKKLDRNTNSRDVHLLKTRCALQTVN